MIKEELEQMSSISREIEDLTERLNKLDNKTVVDSVQGSSTSYPYIKHSCTVEGITDSFTDRNTRAKYRKLLRNNKKALEEKKKQLEYDINSIEDSELRQIIRYRFEDNKKWFEVAEKMNKIYNTNEYTGDGIRMKIKRFLEK